MRETGLFSRVSDTFTGLSGLSGLGEEVNERSRALNVRLLEMAQENTAHGFDTAKAMVEAKNFSEAAQVQQAYVREGLQRGVQQSREVAGLVVDVTAAAFQPLRDVAVNLRGAG